MKLNETRCAYYELLLLFSIVDSTTYAHFLFNAFDTDHNGSVSFEVSAAVTSFPAIEHFAIPCN